MKFINGIGILAVLRMAETETSGGAAVAKAEEVKTLAATDERIPEAARPLVESGALEAEVKEVSVEVKDKKEPAKREYIRLTALTIEGALFLTSGRMTKVTEGDEKGNGVLDYFNYGFDLGVRSTQRNTLLASLEGPEKAIERGVKGLVAAGISEAKAREIVVEQRKLAGLPV